MKPDSSSTITNTLQSLEEYSLSELQEFSQYSPISKTYLRLLKQKDTPHIYLKRHKAWLTSALASYFNNASNKDIFQHWSTAMDEILISLQHETALDLEPLDLMALGKYGSQALNLSSDIDVLFLADNLNDTLLFKVRKFIKLINQKTEWGFISRVDLNLKPEPLKDRFIISPEGLMDYLWNSKELWERLIYTRSRPVLQNIDINQRSDYQDMIKKFCYRKYVNMRLVEDLSDLINKILQHNHDPKNIKLRPGGIRSLELFFNSLQLLYGGRDEDLRTPNTYKLLELLEQKNYIKQDHLKILEKNYDFLRRVENLIQIYTDTQDHSISSNVPIDPKDLEKVCNENTDILLSFMNRVIGTRKKNISHIHYVEDDIDVQKYPHLESFNQFLQKKPQYKDLILSHPKTFKNLLKSLKYSPYLSRVLLLRPDLFDLFLIQKTIINESAEDEILLSQLVDFKLLNSITALGDFLIHFNIDTLTSSLSSTADKCIGSIIKKVYPYPDDLHILRLGKWSSQEIGLKSDLDFVFICDSDVDLKRIRKIIHYIGHHTFYGPFYNIDLRLRPSGSAGPIVTSSEKLKNYLTDNDTSAWMKQSYLRNSFLDRSLKFDFEPTIFKSNTAQKTELMDIRGKRLLSLNAPKISLKETEGGLIDLEFLVQHLCLEHGYYPKHNSFRDICNELQTAGYLDPHTTQSLTQTYKYLRTTEQICALKSTTQDVHITKENAPSLFDLPQSANVFFHTPLSYHSLKETLTQSKELITKHHPFLL